MQNLRTKCMLCCVNARLVPCRMCVDIMERVIFSFKNRGKNMRFSFRPVSLPCFAMICWDKFHFPALHVLLRKSHITLLNEEINIIPIEFSLFGAWPTELPSLASGLHSIHLTIGRDRWAYRGKRWAWTARLRSRISSITCLPTSY